MENAGRFSDGENRLSGVECYVRIHEEDAGKHWRMKESKEILKNRENYTSAKHYHRPIIYRIVNLEIWDVFLGGGGILKPSNCVQIIYTWEKKTHST